mgnify:FL=1
MLQVIPFILFTELCERLAFFGFTGSLPIFFSKVYGFSSNLSAELNLLFVSLVFISPVFGAWIADIYIGRYQAITSFGFLYFVSSALVTIGAIPTIALGLSKLVFFTGLLGITIASGGIKPNVATFGADQFDPTKPDARALRERFFGYFYWSINFGSLIAFGVITNVATGDIISNEKWRFFASFIVPCIAMAAALLLFFAGGARCKCRRDCQCGGYIKPPAQKSEIHRICQAASKTCCITPLGRLLVAALTMIVVGFLLTTASYFLQPAAEKAVLSGNDLGFNSSRAKLTTTTPEATTTDGLSAPGTGIPSHRGLHFIVSLAGFVAMLGGIVTTIVVAASPTWLVDGLARHQSRQRDLQAPPHAACNFVAVPIEPSVKRFHAIAVDAVVVDADSVPANDVTVPPQHTDHSAVTWTDVDNLRMIVRLLPYCAYMALFWASNSNMGSNFLLQACQMNLLWFVDPHHGSSQIGVAFLTVFNTLIICILVPVVDFGIYPLIAKCRGGKQLTVMERILLGFVFAILSTVVATIIEIERKHSPMLPGLDPCCKFPLEDALFNRSACCKFSAGGGKDRACMDSCRFLSSCSSALRPVHMHAYSVWWQCIQYTLTGIAEVFAAIAAFDLFYAQVREHVCCLVAACILSMVVCLALCPCVPQQFFCANNWLPCSA